MVKFPIPAPLLWTGLWAVLLAVALFFRPLLPVDETRYVGVAWEMWLRDDFLVPHLNGDPYSHKPPLLFWLMHAGWSVFGVNDWWPRLVSPAFGLGCVFLTAGLARRLWPDRDIHLLAPLFLLGSVFWGLYTTLTMFDLILTFWTLAGIHGLVSAATAGQGGRRVRGWLLFAAGIGFGVITKGPVILVFLLPPALLAPLWRDTGRDTGRDMRRAGGGNWVQWYLGAAAGVALGAAIALAWALPAGFAGGEAYRNAIFWGQSAGRLVNSFDHGLPVWWYLPLLPVILLPWIIWPTFWRAAGAWLWEHGGDSGTRLAAVWIVAALIALSLISGKRPHYLLPMLPAIALIGAGIIEYAIRRRLAGGWGDLLPWALAALAFAAFVGSAPAIGPALELDVRRLDEWLTAYSPLWALVPLSAGLLLLFVARRAGAASRMLGLAMVSAAILVTVHGVAGPQLSRAYDLKGIAFYLKDLQDRGYAIAHLGKYHGQYNFLGRLEPNITATDLSKLKAWLERNPKAKIIGSTHRLTAGPAPEFTAPFRGRTVAVWDGRALLAALKLETR